ncbi:MAG: hypothetical protein IJQ07_06765 [Clostridia bacterium]|nr:hypothetical protein [Clostridia bacterium]
MEAYKCPNCGAGIIDSPNDLNEVVCRYCNTRIRLRQPTIENINIVENIEHFETCKVVLRVGRLLYLGDYQSAKKLVQKALLYSPDDRSLLELENECNCFLTNNFGNYLKMLAVITVINDNIAQRFIIEINGFCNMLSSKADRNLNIAKYRKQNLDNYGYIFSYIGELRKCLQNELVINCDKLYKAVENAFLKFTTVICNTIYLKNQSKKCSFVKLISLEQRQCLIRDFEKIRLAYVDDKYSVVANDEWDKY